MTKSFSAGGVSVILLIAMMPLLMAACSGGDAQPAVKANGGKESTQSESAAEQRQSGAGGAQVAKSGEELWKRCSACHGSKMLSGTTAGEIKTAIEEVAVMSSFKKTLSPAEMEILADYLGGGEAETKEEEYTYITPQACGACHPAHKAQWRHSLHALSHSEPVYDRYFIKASKDSGQELETFCAGCHTPIAVLNGNIPFEKPPVKPGDTKVSPVGSDGVQCDFCHVMDGYEEVLNGKYTVNPSRTKYGPYADSTSSFHDSEYSKLHVSPEFCGVCHKVIHPDNGIVLENTYTEWKEGPYAKEGIICQDCHMTDGLNEGVEHPGKACTESGAPERAHVSKHYFVGPNVMFAQGEDAAELKKRSLKLLKSAAVVEVAGAAVEGGKIVVSIDVTNTGAGHYLPTGVTEIRELWLDIEVTGADGRTLHRSGALDDKGDLEDGTIVYRTEVYNKEGKMTTQFWQTVRKGRDHRIPPKETVTERIAIGGVAGAEELKVRAALKYRSVPPYGLEEVGAPADLVEVPVITIADAEETLAL